MSYNIPYIDYPVATGVCNNCGGSIFQRIEPSGYASWKHEIENCARGAILMRGSWGLKPIIALIKGEK